MGGAKKPTAGTTSRSGGVQELANGCCLRTKTRRLLKLADGGAVCNQTESNPSRGVNVFADKSD